MIKKFGITIGGLQQKIVNLVLIFALLIIGLFVAVSIYMAKELTKIVEKSGDEQKASITKVSQETMQGTLNVSMTQSAEMQASIADNLFTAAQGNVLTLQEYAEYLFTHRDEYTDKTVSAPLPENDGIPSVQLQHEAAVDPADDPDLGLLANMNELLLSMYNNSGVVNSTLAATTHGDIIFVDDRAGANFNDDGTLQTFEVRERPWYTGAIEKGGLYYTGIELDAFTNIPGLVCSAPVYADGELVAVVGADVFLYNISEYVNDSTKYGGFVCIVNQNGEIIFSPKKDGTFKAVTSDQAADLRKGENAELGAFVTKALTESTGLETVTVDGVEYYLCGAPMKTVGWTVISGVAKELSDQPTNAMLAAYDDINNEALGEYNKASSHSQNVILLWTAILLTLAFIGALTVAGRIVKPIETMTRRIDELSEGDLQFKMEDAYRTKDEIELLAEAFAELSAKTVQYIGQITTITAEKERIGAELELATRIQANMLPNLFPAFPQRSDFDIYASMTPAKEVGGDFYDFMLLDDDHLAVVIADVSGKGVPAALFMMMAMILIDNTTRMEGPEASPGEVLTRVNNTICANNEEEMFVTVWLGILDLKTGKVKATNAGHEYPIIKKADGKFELLKDKHGMVVGAMEGLRYKDYEFKLEEGGTLFLYTDGVAEATNAENKLFGTERTIEALNEIPEESPEKLLKKVKENVDIFVGEAPQFDDLTMISVKINKQHENEDKNDKDVKSDKQ